MKFSNDLKSPMGAKGIKISSRILPRLGLLPSGYQIINLQVYKSVKLLNFYMAALLEKCDDSRKLKEKKKKTLNPSYQYIPSSPKYMPQVLLFIKLLLYYTQRFMYLNYNFTCY